MFTRRIILSTAKESLKNGAANNANFICNLFCCCQFNLNLFLSKILFNFIHWHVFRIINIL